MISKTLGIEGKKLLTPEDDYEALKEFNHAYEGTKTAIEEMHLEYQALIQEHPELDGILNGFPGAIFSGRKRPAKGARGVFFCYAPACLGQGDRRVHRGSGNDTLVSLRPGQRRDPRRPRRNHREHPLQAEYPSQCITEEKTLKDIRAKVIKHIKNTYLKRVDAPVGVKPALKCWMEMNEG